MMKSIKANIDNRLYAIYARKSKYTGKGNSINNQIEDCKRKLKFAFENIDLEKDVLIYEDEGFTGYNLNRPGFQRMLKDIQAKKIKMVVFYKLDRISRNVTDFSNLVNKLNDYDVTFLSATENIENVTPTGRAMMFMTSVFAQLERDTTAERVQDNMIELAKTGRWLGGNPPTGFKSQPIEEISIDGKKRTLYKLTFIDNEIMKVKLLFNKYLEFKSQTQVETYTIQNDIKTKNGKTFTRWGIKNILLNPVYATADQDILNYFKELGVTIYADDEDFDGTHGLMVYNKTEKKKNMVSRRDMSEWIIAIGKHEGTIPGKDWVNVQKILDQNSDMKYRKPNASNCILSGILKCAYCGSFMRAKMKNKTVDEHGRRRFDYMCELKDKSRKQKCQCKNINGLEADDLVLAEIKKIVCPTSKLYQELKRISENSFNSFYQNNLEVRTLRNQMNKNERDISSLLDRIKYVDIELLDDISKEIKHLREVNLQIEKQIGELTNYDYNEIKDSETADFLLNIMDNYFTIFDTLDLNTKRNLIKTLVSSITTDGENITINLIGARPDVLIFPTGASCK